MHGFENVHGFKNKLVRLTSTSVWSRDYEQGETGDGRLISARIDSQKVWADVSKGER